MDNKKASTEDCSWFSSRAQITDKTDKSRYLVGQVRSYIDSNERAKLGVITSSWRVMSGDSLYHRQPFRHWLAMQLPSLVIDEISSEGAG